MTPIPRRYKTEKLHPGLWLILDPDNEAIHSGSEEECQRICRHLNSAIQEGLRQSAVLEEHSPQQTQEGMGLPDGRLSDEEIERLSTPEQWEGEDYMLGAMDMGLMVHKRDRMEAARIVKHVLRYCRDHINKSPTP